jgi:hypothetical protein
MRALLVLALIALSPTVGWADDADVHAQLNIVGANLLVTNADTWTWHNVRIKLNSGVFTGGYAVEFDSLAAGKSMAIPLREFTTNSGERFDFVTRKVIDVLVSAHDAKGGFHNNVYRFR